MSSRIMNRNRKSSNTSNVVRAAAREDNATTYDQHVTNIRNDVANEREDATTSIVATTTTNTNVANVFVANASNAPHMNDAMRANVNAREDVNERREIVALFEQLNTHRDTIDDNTQKSIRRELRKRNFRISMFTRTSSSNVVANAIATYDASMKRV